ncbi:hypothetical protein BO78DRAFT_373950 [Aspergillus sclerotiicarbonarius CBS 121057]|uniref:Uncharacterized protein n=1 Tax=Aspergillus sclerotiicarbonarius (strain CBS 121057 / IBT 28362) TaxID=1448318 RepID=A0A319E1U8_ASPSB|nr:hypothetical protein BO78DRAFT_373950 [Aspergillus sclerotiicarbonarius CBS 121057]
MDEELFRKVRQRVRARMTKTVVVLHDLTRILNATKELDHTALTDSDLEALGIKSSELDLEGAPHGDHKSFYQPLPRSELPVIKWDKVRFSEWSEGYSDEVHRVEYTLQSVSNKLLCSWLENDKKLSWSQQECHRERPSVATGEHTFDAPYQWQTFADFQSDSIDIPHCSFRMYHYAEPEESLRRSEVLAITGYMRCRLRQFDYVCHYTFPVVAISIFRSKVRILHAYHDGHHLYVSKSQFVDVKENNHENYELLVRWVHGTDGGPVTAAEGKASWRAARQSSFISGVTPACGLLAFFSQQSEHPTCVAQAAVRLAAPAPVIPRPPAGWSLIASMPPAQRSVATADMPFIVSTNTKKVDPHTRKLIRSHVMIGKNRGKSRYRQAGEGDLPRPADASTDDAVASPPPQTTRAAPDLPRRIGNDLSMIQLADDSASPAALATILRFTERAKTEFYPLAVCIVFNTNSRTWMLEMLSLDAAYLNAMVFTTQSYFRPGQGSDLSLSPHFVKTIRLLRDRLADEQLKVSNATVMIVILLILHAHIMGDFDAVRHHTEGLRKMVRLRGGLGAFMSNNKLVIDLIRCDVGLAIHSGGKPAFFENRDLDIFVPSALCFQTRRSADPAFVRELDPGLARIWHIMQGFCAQINLTVESNGMIPEKDFLKTMASVMYPLLHMSFDCGSRNEAIRLALLSYGFDIFLQWRTTIPYANLATSYRRCLSGLVMRDDVSPELWIWLLTVGGLSVFVPSARSYFRQWLLYHLGGCGVHTWAEMRAILSSFMWIGLVHDRAGKDIFDSVLTHMVSGKETVPALL